METLSCLFSGLWICIMYSVLFFRSELSLCNGENCFKQEGKIQVDSLLFYTLDLKNRACLHQTESKKSRTESKRLRPPLVFYHFCIKNNNISPSYPGYTRGAPGVQKGTKKESPKGPPKDPKRSQKGFKKGPEKGPREQTTIYKNS